MNSVINNEAFAVIAIHSLLSNQKGITLANVYVGVTLSFDKKIRNYLKRKTTNIVSIQQLVTSKSELLIGFNEKFTDSLITSTNAISIGLELKIFKLVNGLLTCEHPFECENKEAGTRTEELILATPNIARLLSEPSNTTYSLLRIKI